MLNWIFVSDPGLHRLRTAARVMLAVTVAGLLSYLVVGQKALVAPLFGGIVGLLGSLVISDPDPKQQKITALLLIVPASLSVALGALLGPFPWLSNVALVFFIFLAFYLRRFGPRFMAFGMIAFMPFFLTTIISSRPMIPFGLAQLPWIIAALAIGVTCVFVVRFVFLRDKPERVLRWSVSAFHTQLALTLSSIIAVIEGKEPVEKAKKRLRRDAERLNECAMAAEDQLSAPDFEGSEERSDRLRFYLFDSEMSAHILSEIAPRLALPNNAIPSYIRDSLLHSLQELREPLSKGEKPDSYTPASEALEELERRREQSSESTGGWSYQVQRAEDAIRQLLRGAGEDRETPQSSKDTPEDSEEGSEDGDESDTGSGSGSLKERFQTTTLQGVQAALAVSLALVAGHLLSPSRSYWVVISAFIVFMRGRSIGETFARGFRRTFGTLLGLIAGFSVASVLSGDFFPEIALIFVCTFMAFYLFSVSYAWMTFWITIALAIGYGLIGWLSGSLLAIRFIDTLVGAAIGVAVSAVVFPTKTAENIKDGALDFLEAFNDYLCARMDMLASDVPEISPVEEVRELGDKLREVTQTVDTIKKQAAVFGRFKTDLDHLTTALMALDYYARHLARPVKRRNFLDDGGPQSELLKELGRCIAANVDVLSRSISDGEKRAMQNIEDLLERLESEARTPEASINKEPTEDMLYMLHYLRRIDRTIVDVAMKLGAAGEESHTSSPSSGSAQ